MKSIIFLLSKLKSLRKWFVLASLMSVGATLFKTGLSSKLSNLIDMAIDKDVQLNSHVIWSIVLILVVYLILNALEVKYVGTLVGLGEKKLRIFNISQLVNSDILSLQKEAEGSLLNRFNDDTTEFVNAVGGFLCGTISCCLKMLVILFVVGRVSWPLAVYAFVVPILYNFWFLNFSKRIQPVNRKEREKKGELSSHFVDCLMGKTEIYSFKLEHHMLEENSRILQERDSLERQKARFWSFVSMCDAIMSSLYPVSIVVIGIGAVNKGWISWGDILLFLTLSPTFLNFIWDLDPQSYRRAVAAAERVRWLWDIPKERIGGNNYDLVGAESAFSLENIRFNYTNREDRGITLINLSIAAGKSIAIVGESGAGKTTLLNLLCGFLEGHEGNLIVGGHTIDEWNLDALRRNICYMSQSSVIFDDTLLFNVTLGDRYEDTRRQQEQVENLLHKVGLGYLVENPLGIQAKINTISDGERQRIALARCLYKNAPIWLLDEPTSALDLKTELEMLRCIQDACSTGKTVIAVTHRLPLARVFDEIYVMDKGVIVESGNHAALMEKKGYYYHLYLQIEDET